jgi:FdhD protein
VTGILLVGGASIRFGSPKALVPIDGETFADRAWRLLGDACEFRLAVGKRADALTLPFDLVDDEIDVRAAMAGIVAGLRAASTDLCVVIPIDCPSLDRRSIEALAGACKGRAATPQTGPLPGAYRRSALPVLERRLAAGDLRLRDAAQELEATTTWIRPGALVNVNKPTDGAAAPKRTPPPYSTAPFEVIRFPASPLPEPDVLAVEEPLEIKIDGEPVAITMRTPGSDEELALGFAIGEGLDPTSAGLPSDLAANTIELVVASFNRERLHRHFYTSSSCGVCGKGALAAVAVTAAPSQSSAEFDASTIASLPERLRASQHAFEVTGGLHAAGLFDQAGNALCVREDVGRHNALDKVVGWAFQSELLPIDSLALCVSGRLSFELVQKASAAGCPLLVGVGAPSSLAVELARKQNLTLCGFARGGRMNVYSAFTRIRY